MTENGGPMSFIGPPFGRHVGREMHASAICLSLPSCRSRPNWNRLSRCLRRRRQGWCPARCRSPARRRRHRIGPAWLRVAGALRLGIGWIDAVGSSPCDLIGTSRICRRRLRIRWRGLCQRRAADDQGSDQRGRENGALGHVKSTLLHALSNRGMAPPFLRIAADKSPIAFSGRARCDKMASARGERPKPPARTP